VSNDERDKPGNRVPPAPDLPTCPTLGAASRQKDARPFLAARGGAAPRVAACGRRFSRNPGYLSLTMLYAGIAVLRNALWAVVLLPVVVYVIEREERYLERTFGEEYLNYKAPVHRWV
jgi:Phospholipid methyltransferase